ncbi:MAG: hypothetical protein V4563_18220 [Pseudomonadota bacterium]
MGTKSKVNTNEPSTKPGEEDGVKKDEQVAAEQPLDSAEKTNPVAEATGRESKDPYAEGKHIANPEPNNGLGEDPEKATEQADEEAADEAEKDQETQAENVQAQEERQVDPAGAKEQASK